MTGATGAIGRPLFAALRARGDEVTVLSRDPDAARAALPGAVRYLRWSEAAPPEELTVPVEGADAVVHLAGGAIFGSRVSRADVSRMTAGKVRSTGALAQAMSAVADRPAVFVNASSQGWYGFAPRDRGQVSTEASPPGTDVWARENQEWEQAARPAANAGVRVVQLRTGVHLGTRTGPIAAQLEQFRRGGGTWVRPGTQAFNWISEQDATRLALLALDDDRVDGAINLTAPEPATQRAFAEALAAATGTRLRFGLPGAALRLFVGVTAEILVNSHPVLPRKALDLGHRFVDTDLAATVAGIVATLEQRAA